MTRSIWPWSRPQPRPAQPHTLLIKAWPPELKGEGLGILGVVLIAVVVIGASATGVPIAREIVTGATRAAEFVPNSPASTRLSVVEPHTKDSRSSLRPIGQSEPAEAAPSS